VAAEPERWRRQSLDTQQLVAHKPGDGSMPPRILQKRREAETFDRRCGQAGDEFAAHAMPRIFACVDYRDSDAGTLKRESERKSSEAATDDFDRARHGRRVATK
jgi:hypothetical protein